MAMFSVNRFLWLFMLLCVAALAISSVQSLTEEKGDERLGAEDFFEEGVDNFDYDSVEEVEGEKHDFGGLPPPPVNHPYHPQPPQYIPPPPPPTPQYVEQPAYLPPPPPPKYQEPSYVAPPPQEVYQAPPPVYQAPVQQAPAYQPAVYEVPALNYTQPAYQSPQPTYQPVYPSQVSNYSQPPQPAPTYQPVYPSQVSNYSYTPQAVPSYQPAYPTQVSNYSQPAQPVQTYQPVYQAPVANYSQPPKQNYSAPTYVKPQQQVAYATIIKQTTYSPSYLAQKYSLSDLVPLTNPIGYRANHWTLHYYRFNVYRQQCPKQMYAGGPNYKDIEQAFAFAIQQLGQFRQGNFMNANTPSFAARHQIFNFLAQQNARMDEEGLLVEFVSHYLAERLCMTKWDRQRYLPSLTRIIKANQFPQTHSCSQYYGNQWQTQAKNCYQSKYRTYDGFCNNPYHPYWGKANVCHIRLLSPDYADGISLPRESHNPRYPLPNPRVLANVIHNDVPLDGPYNLMKMQWGQFINHDITNTALSSYDGLVDCCKQPKTRGCWPILVPPGDYFYGSFNVTCLNFIRSGVCATCQLGPRQQTNKNTAFIDASHVYGNGIEQANQLRTFVRGQLRSSGGRGGEELLPIASSQEQCSGACYQAGDTRVNQHPALTVLHTLLLRNHNRHAYQLSLRHPNWNDETLFQEARRINIAEYQMITYNEYLPIVFGPILSAYFQLTPSRNGYTQYNPKVDPTTWNEYSTAACRFGHSQISSVFGIYSKILGYGQTDPQAPTFRLKDWFMRPSLLADGQMVPVINGLLARPALSVDPWVTTDVRNHLYQAHTEKWGGDLAATNIWRGRDHGLPGYVHYLEYCFNFKVRGWKDLQLFIPPTSLAQMRKMYRVVENVDLFTGGLAERHFPGADIGPTFACINGIQYNHLKFGDRYFFEHAGQAGSFNPAQLEEIKRASLARLLCRTAALPAVPQYAFLQPSLYNPLVNCSRVGDIDYNKF